MLDAKGGLTRRKRETIPVKARRQFHERDSYIYVLCGLVGEGQNHNQKIKGYQVVHIQPNAAGALS